MRTELDKLAQIWYKTSMSNLMLHVHAGGGKGEMEPNVTLNQVVVG